MSEDRRYTCAFVGGTGFPDGDGCTGARSQLGKLTNVNWLGLDGEPLTLPDLARLCLERVVDVVVVVADTSDGAEPPDVTLERVWTRCYAQTPPGFVTILFGGEVFEKPHAKKLVVSPKWTRRGLVITCFSFPFFLSEIAWGVEQAARFANDALCGAQHRVPPSRIFPTCIGWRPTAK